jgi:hypothetical protein
VSGVIWRVRRRLIVPLFALAVCMGLAVPSFASATPTTTTGDIAGTVTEGGAAVTNLTVMAYAAGINPFSQSYLNSATGETTATGTYDLSGLAPGTYTVLALPTETDGYIPTFSNGASTYAAATTVTVTANQTTSATNVAMVKGGVISGTITGPSGAGVGDIGISVEGGANDAYFGSDTADVLYSDGSGGTEEDGLIAETSTTAGSVGTYSITGVPAGTYYVDIQGSDDATDDYANVWFGGSATKAGAQAVTIGTGGSSTVNQALSKAAEITGTLNDGVNGGVFKAVPFDVYVYDNNGEYDEGLTIETTQNGVYTLPGLLAGTYYLEFVPTNTTGPGATTFATAWYDGSTLAESRQTAQGITVAAGATATATTVALPSGGSVSGSVQANGGALSGVRVELYDSAGNAIDDNNTNLDGSYNLDGGGNYYLPGSYKVGFTTDGGANLAFQYYNNASTLAAATAVTVAGGGANTPNINATLTTGGEITGTVTGTSSSPLAGVDVELEDASGNVLETTSSGPDGTYTLAGVPTGTYYVEFDPSGSEFATQYQVQYYGGKQVLAGSTTVSVTAGQTTSGINATLTAATTAGQVTTTTQITTVPAAIPTVVGSPPLISGTVKVGRALAAKETGWTAGTTYAYQWFAAGKAVKGATNATLTLAAADYKKTITVMVTGKLSGYNWVTETSAKTKAVAAGVLTTKLPKISGTAKVGSKLTAKAGAWTKGAKLTYQWYAGKKAIKRATKSTLKLVAADKGKTVTVKVTGRLTGYATARRTSRATKKVGG